jgi:hypothetical protein
MPDMNLDGFAALQGQRFELRAPNAIAVTAQLVEARKLPAAPYQGRQPFALLFKGPASPVLPQNTYQVTHTGSAQPIDIFLVPVSADASGACYEAVFS